MVSDAADHGVNSTQFMKLLAVNLSAVLGYVRGCSGSLPGKRAAAEGLHILNRLLDKVENPKFYLKVYEAIQSQGGAAELVPLVGRPGEEARASALSLMGRLLIMSKLLQESGNSIANANESKPDLVLRLMSASLIELRGIEALEAMNCGGKELWGEDMLKRKQELSEKINIKPEQDKPATPDRARRSSDAFDISRSPNTRRKERIVSDFTVEVAAAFVCGQWSNKDDTLSIQKNSILHETSIESVDQVVIALPEGLLLLLGLLASPSLSPSIVETTITKISLWIKMDAANATKILSCGHWQRWFLGLYLVFEKRNSESSSERSAMTVSQSIVADIIACLYSQLILRVKHGYQQWRVTLKLLEHHADRTSILRNLLSLSFRRLYSDLQQQKRTNKQLSSATADNIVYTFQLVDQWILPAKQTSANNIPESENYALEKSKNSGPNV